MSRQKEISITAKPDFVAATPVGGPTSIQPTFGAIWRSAMLSSEHLSLPTWADDDLARYEVNKTNPEFGGIQMEIEKNTLQRRNMRIRTRQSRRHVRHFESAWLDSEALGVAGSNLV